MLFLPPKFAFMQPLPGFRFSCFNPTKVIKQSSCFLCQADEKQHSLLPGQVHTQQPSEELAEFQVHGTKHGTLPQLYQSLTTIQKTDQWNGLLIIPQSPASSLLLLNQAHSRLKLRSLPCLSLTQSFHISSPIHSLRTL